MGIMDMFFPGKAYCAFCGYLNYDEAKNIKNGSYPLQSSRTFGMKITRQNPVVCPDCGLQMPLTDDGRMAKQNGLKRGFQRKNESDLTKDERGKAIGPGIGAEALKHEKYLMNPSKWT